MHDININSFKSFSIFKVLFENGTASKTAKILGITQSGVSRSLALLEQNIGFLLFIRDKNKLIATPEAKELYKEVLRLMFNLDETKHSILALREFGASRVRMAAIPGLAFGYIPKMISKMLSHNSKLNIFFDVLSSNEIVRAVEAGAFDIGFVTMPIDSQQIEIEVIEKTQAVCIIPQGHALAKHEKISLNDLSNCHLVVSNQPNIASDQLLQLISENKIELSGKTEANITSICSLVSNGVGISVINPITVYDLNCANILVKPFIPEIHYSFGLIYKKHWKDTKILEIIKHHLQLN